jgi:hypothetical protein
MHAIFIYHCVEVSISDVCYDHQRRVKHTSLVNLAQLRDEYGDSVATIDWMPGFFSLDPSIQIAGS